MVSFLTNTAMCHIILLACYVGAAAPLVELRFDATSADPLAGLQTIGRQNGTVEARDGYLRLVDKTGAGALSVRLQDHVENGDYVLDFDIWPEADNDHGYTRTIYHSAVGGQCLWLIELSPGGALHVYTTDSMARDGRVWAVRRTVTGLGYGRWYQVKVRNECERVRVTASSRGVSIFDHAMRHDRLDHGPITFCANGGRVTGHRMGLRLDNVVLRGPRSLLAGPLREQAGHVEVKSVWDPATECKTLHDRWRLRPSSISDPLDRWLADLAIRDALAVGADPSQAARDLLASHPRLSHRGRHRIGWVTMPKATGERRYLLVADNRLGLGLTPARDGGSVASLYLLDKGVESISRPPEPGEAVWELECRRMGQGNPRRIPPRAAKEANDQVEVGTDEALIKMRWEGVAVTGLPGHLDVETAVRFASGGLPQMSIAVENRLEQDGLWRIIFPTVWGLGYDGESDVCSMRAPRPSVTIGQLLRGCVGRTRSAVHPGSPGGVQHLSLSCGRDAVTYVAMADPLNCSKGWNVAPGRSFAVWTWPENALQPGVNYRQNWEVVIGAMPGDWYDAAQRYRAWALRQRWCQAGPLHARRMSDRFRHVAFWVRPSFWRGQRADQERVANPESLEQVRRNEAFYRDLPLGVMWYMWHHALFDDDCPELFPAVPGFAEEARREVKAGCAVMPYIQGRDWDMDLASFARVRPHAAKNERGEVMSGRLRIGAVKVATMCPSQPFWQQTIADLAKRCRDELGVNAIYVDVVATQRPAACFDATHGHPLGPGGQWFADGQRSLFSAVRRACGNDFAITSECFCEAYIDRCDGFLVGAVPIDPLTAPLVPAVYSGYTLCYGWRIGGDGRLAFRVKSALGLLWGVQLGVIMRSAELRDTAKAEFMRKLVRVRARANEFLSLGQMMRPPAWSAEPPKITCPSWDRESGTPRLVKVTGPALRRALWRAPSGRFALLIVNCADQPVPASLAVQPHVARDLRRGEAIQPTGIDGWATVETEWRGDEMQMLVPAGTPVLVVGDGQDL